VHTGGPKVASFSQKVEHCAFSPDSRLLATAARDGSARLWDVRTGALAAPPMPDGDVCVAFSPDGRWLATGGASGVARVWNARTGAAITPPLLHDATVSSVEFDARGERLVTGSWDGEARVWDLAPDERGIDEIAGSAELLACQRVDASGGLVELSADELRVRWEALHR
jgi:WD40 repeat protein